MQLNYKFFYKQFGIRRLQSLLSPRLIDLHSLPRDTIIHYQSNDGQVDIDASKLYFRQYTKRILVDYPTQLADSKGTPKPKSVILKTLIRPFHVQNKKFLYMKDHFTTIKDEFTLLVDNYNYLDLLYRYVDLPMTKYYKWWNVQKTIWSNVNEIANNSTRNQFVFIDIPDELPGYSFLNIYSTKANITLLKIFDSPSKLSILELWKWLSVEHRAESSLAAVETKNFNKVNLVFTNSDNKSIVLNLGYLNSWIKGQENTTEFSSISQFSPLQIQKIFLKFLMVMQESFKEEEEVIEAEVAKVEEDPLDIEEEEEEYEDEVEQDHIHHPEDYEDSFSPMSSAAIAKKHLDSKKTTQLDEDTEMSSDSFMDQLAAIDTDIEDLEQFTMRRLKSKAVNIKQSTQAKDDSEKLKSDFAGIDTIIEGNDTKLSHQDVKDMVYGDKDYVGSVMDQLDDYADYGLLSAGEYKKLVKDLDNFNSLKDPYGSKQTLVEAMVVTAEDILIDEKKSEIVASENVIDKSMLSSSLQSFDRDYISKVLSKDVLAMTASLQRAGVIIKKHEIELDASALGEYENHTLELKPIDGVASTIRFRLPKVNEDGDFTSNANKYRLRSQRTDVPIRKIDPTTVALTSYYGKNFVRLSTKKANSSLEWIIKQIDKSTMVDHPTITKVAPANVFDNNFVAPYIYNALASKYKSFKAGRYLLAFDHSVRIALVNGDEDTLAALETDDKRLVGISDNKELVVVDTDNQFYALSKGELAPIGDIYSLLQLPQQSAPVDFTEVRVFSKSIPVGIALGYFLGFNNLLAFLNVPYRTVEGRKNKALTTTEFSISFKDQSYIFNRKDKVASMIIAGFNDFEKEIKQYDTEDFNSKHVYLNLLTSKGLSALYIRELELTDQLFVDPITKSILESMDEPTTFKGLLVRSTEMLQTYHHPDSQDMSVMRIRGYERLAGAVYKEMSVAIRQFKNRNISGRAKIEISPYQVLSSVMKDQSMKIVEDINPIQNLKESEIVTYAGVGGREKQSMNRASRAYHRNDMGVISEATVDSSDVGINTYMSANPSFKNLRGITNVGQEITPASLVSTSALLAPGSNNDDAKRTGFTNVQNSHSISCDGYHQPYVRTGYESVIANRTSAMFAYTAKQEGKIVSKNKLGIIVEYTDGSKKGISLGRVFGKAEGSIYPHDIVSDLEVGDVVKKGTPIAYNTGFFERDSLDPSNIVFKTSMSIKTALIESNQTHEDSSSISKSLATKLKTKTTKVKSVVVDFNQNILNVVKPGQRVHTKDILMIIEDEITSTNSSFDEESLSVLKRLSNQAPKSSYEGVIDKIEVLYHGDREDMSSSLLAVVDQSDKLRLNTAKATEGSLVTGQVNDDYRVKGKPLTIDKAEIKFYITIDNGCSVGDKAIFANQMKSVVGEVMDYDMHTESGEKIDAVFGYRSIAARIVLSPLMIGTTTTLLKLIGQQAVKLYRG